MPPEGWVKFKTPEEEAEYKRSRLKQQADYRLRWKNEHPEVSAWSRVREMKRNGGHSDFMPRKEFYNWYKSEPKFCYYCGIPAELLEITNRIMQNGKLKVNWMLTLDRMDNDKGYIRGNIAFACYLCNHVKSNIFTADEMVGIAHKYITPKWREQHEQGFICQDTH